MNKLFLLCSVLLLGSGTAQAEEPEPLLNCQEQKIVYLQTSHTPENETRQNKEEDKSVSFSLVRKEKPFRVGAGNILNDIEYIEDEVELTFDFDLKAYLPRGFNPHEPYFDIHSIQFIEDEVKLEYDFDLKDYLPEGFDVHSSPEIMALNAIEYIEDEVELTFDFDLKAYLPRGFNPYEAYFDIHSIEYIENEVELDYDFDLKEYLPKEFDPHTTSTEL